VDVIAGPFDACASRPKSLFAEQPLYSDFNFVTESGMLADITPDKSLVKKLGLSGYRTEQALAELVDNSIDARIPGRTEHIVVRLDFERHRIVVEDDGCGMDGGGLAQAMVIARSDKDEGKLGRFGIGMKGACSALGRRFEIVTSQEGSGVRHRARYDEKEWLGDASKGWDNFEVEEARPARGEEDWHGTRVIIDPAAVPMYSNQTARFRERFGTRYSPYLESGQVDIRINTLACSPAAPALADGSEWEPVDIRLAQGRRIAGRLGLLQKRSVRGEYGIHLFKNGRLIKAFEKFGFPAHPENSRLIGDLSLDHVPVSFNKSTFIKESDAYVEALDEFGRSGALSRALRSSRPSCRPSASVASVMDYFGGRGPPRRMERRIRASESARVLDLAAGREFAAGVPGGAAVSIRFGKSQGGPLYETSAKGEGEGVQVSVNTGSPAFGLVGNPAFLVGLIASEAELISKYPEHAARMLEERNRRVEGFVREWEKAGAAAPAAAAGERRHREPSVPDVRGYGLYRDLLEIHDHLRAVYPMRFQFTALSTLRPYLHNLLGRVVYTVHAPRGNGDELAGRIMDEFKGRVSAVDRPAPDTIKALFYSGPASTVVAVREYASIPNSTVAPPAKALVDLVVEKDVHKAPIHGDEPRMVLHAMLRHGLVDLAEVRRQARRAKQSARIEAIIGAGPA